jgi:hypothetical protein
VAIVQDQTELSEILVALDVEPSRMKQALAWIAATAGVVKLNRRLYSYSPLSRVEETEALSAAVTAKLCLWKTLGELAASDERLDASAIAHLQERARRQLASLADMHRDAASIAFAMASEPRRSAASHTV